MNSFRKLPRKEPTTSKPRNVASSESQRSRTLRGLLADELRSIRRGRPLPADIEGDLSTWIRQLHGLNGDKAKEDCPTEDSGAQVLPTLAKWMEQLAGIDLDPAKVKATIAKANEIRDRYTTEELKSLYAKNKDAFESQFERDAREVLGIWEVPPGLPTTTQFVSFEGALKMLRAIRALAICLAIHENHPLLLINRASKGDRQATLDLVKVDKLFLHDACTKSVIRTAELRNDHRFLRQLTRAQNYQPKLGVRQVQHLYFYSLFMLEKEGNLRMPVGHKLWRILDPRAREYDSLDAFERDLQRRRKGFEQMLSEIAAKNEQS